jgi:hypothetical protein
MAVYFQYLTLGALGSGSALSVLFGALFKKFSLFLYTPRIAELHSMQHSVQQNNSVFGNTNLLRSNNLRLYPDYYFAV